MLASQDARKQGHCRAVAASYGDLDQIVMDLGMRPLPALPRKALMKMAFVIHSECNTVRVMERLEDLGSITTRVGTRRWHASLHWDRHSFDESALISISCEPLKHGGLRCGLSFCFYLPSGARHAIVPKRVLRRRITCSAAGPTARVCRQRARRHDPCANSSQKHPTCRVRQTRAIGTPGTRFSRRLRTGVCRVFAIYAACI